MSDNSEVAKELFEELRRRVEELYDDPLQLLSRKDVWELTKLPQSTLDFQVSTGQLKGIRLSKRNIRFHPLMILDWYAERLGVEYRKPQKKKKQGK